MLVLSRKAKQRIQIGENISITVLRVKGQAVRIGIDAPAEIRVRRSELAVFDSTNEKNDEKNGEKDAEKDATTIDAGSATSDGRCPIMKNSDSKAMDRHKNVQRLPNSSDFRRVEDPFVRHGRSSAVAAQR